ncbi:YsnF/AvaK domain-containing protein [Ramlibacter sp.]|uniref:YsnF/AvaK domain-containing protein n=1 Tax=Ramlibacter sp. TaxID=1917967 RepID=UPI001822285C|nr:YsnF/AvaK domain-containing protein [Ramlibacter sp.]MBA2672697.1 YsnF/AvaK domain-containing protein [Ramlibacter sp.]
MNNDKPTARDETLISVVEERLEVGKRLVDTGRTLRVQKHVREMPVQLREELAVETVSVERVPVGRTVSEPPAVRQEGEFTIIPVVEERLVVRKELVLVEEVRIHRRQAVRAWEESATVRQESVDIERFDPATQQWRPEQDS